MTTDRRALTNKRRDERQTAVPDIRPPAKSKSKDTKKWCRGKVGTEHAPECVDYNTYKRTTFAPEWRLLVCKNCGKELDGWWPNRFLFNQYKSPPNPKPEWVTF